MNTAGAASTPALRALPVSPGDIGATSRKWYTITVSLRESYDDNPNTTAQNTQTAYETSLTPSLLVDFPMVDGGFTGAFSGNATYYDYVKSSPSTVNGGGAAYPSSLQYNGEANGQFSHQFSDRFQLSLSDDLKYYTDPDFFQSVGTYYQNGPYINNLFGGTFTAQWTPLIGTSTSYNNTVVHYFENLVGQSQDSEQNTFTQGLSFAILPKISLNFGGTYDDIEYNAGTRGYTSYTGYTGLTWVALPSLTLSGSLGGTYTETSQATTNEGTNPTSQVSPYANVSLGWTLGAKSSLSFSYSHAITPAQDGISDGQESDRASVSFNYQVSPDISTHLTGIYTLASVTPALASDATQLPYSDTSFGIDTGISYTINGYLSADFNYTVTDVSSQIQAFNYTRNQVSFGIRGTY
jgi:hypothetical protein